jgi:hypothetical protein
MTFIDQWDSGQPGATYDSGLQYDVNVGPSNGNVAPYLALVTSEHSDKPKFMTMLAMVVQPIADIQALIASLPAMFDLDLAVGPQLDILGQLIGVSRILREPLVGVYFTLGGTGPGFGVGTWKGPFDPDDFLTTLPDDAYRLLLRAKVLNNKWDGTIPSAYAIWEALFEGTDFGILIQDYGNMHMAFALTGPTPDAVTLALFLGGYLNIKPAGVTIDGYITPTEPDTPYFGFGVENASISGFGVGAWGNFNN